MKYRFVVRTIPGPTVLGSYPPHPPLPPLILLIDRKAEARLGEWVWDPFISWDTDNPLPCCY